MLEKPFQAAGRLAAKVQVVATRLALSASRVATKMANRAAAIQTRAQARRHARLIKALPNRPSVTFLREVRHGRMSFSFYRSVHPRNGQVREFWTLTRETGRGRVRLATGTMDEFRDIRRSIGQQASRQASRERPTQARRAETPAPREVHRAQSPPAEQRASSGPERRREVETAPERSRPRERTTYSLVHVERLNPDGRTATARVVRSFGTLAEAREARARVPGLALYARPGWPRRGQLVSVDRGESPEVIRRVEQLRAQARVRPDIRATPSPTQAPNTQHRRQGLTP